MATKYLFTVNPGSNTVSMFSIKPSDPLHPVLVGNPADTLGDFPMSVAYSSSLSMGKYGESFLYHDAPKILCRSSVDIDLTKI